MIILGIETSCDETGVCLIEARSLDSWPSARSKKGSTLTILGNQLYSQVAIHEQYGGVFPMMAKREHAKNLVPLLKECLKEASLLKKIEEKKVSDSKIKKIEKILEREDNLFVELNKLLETIEKPNIDYIAVTHGPGLEPALWVGVTFAKALSEAWDIPLIPTNHMEGHIVVASILLDKENSDKNKKLIYNLKSIDYPAVALLISGGHTQIVLINENLNYKIVGNTKDDAVGEAYDKVARMLGLPYPGGKTVTNLAKKEREEYPNKKPPYILPRPMIHSKDYNFSFSGLKTAVLYTLKKIPTINEKIKQEISLEFENVVLDVLSYKTSQAIEDFNAKTLIIGGGVSANQSIRDCLENVCKKYNTKFLVPEVSASTDNAMMIALAGYINILAGKKPEKDFKANGNLSL